MIIGKENDTPHPFVIDRVDEVLQIKGDIHHRMEGIGVGPVPYNTAWVARIGDTEGEPEFPKSLEWLVVNQKEDGSWGSLVFHEYDRFINTLAAAIALRQWGYNAEAISKAEAYLTGAIDRLQDSIELRGSDHIIAMLIEEARQVGLSIPYEKNPHRMMSYWKRLYFSYFYTNPEHALSVMIEVLGRTPNQKKIVKRMQMEDGSLGPDPSTAAASLVFDSKPKLDHSYYSRLRFLREYSLPDGGVSHLGDCETFEKVYNLYHLLWVLPRSQSFMDVAKLLLNEKWTEDGLSFSKHWNSPDLDNTAMAYRILAEIGHEPDPHSLDKFWKGDFWTVFIYYNRPHVGPNIHALEAIAVSSHPDRDEMIDTTLKCLRQLLIDGNHFIDEWHISPAYPTSHAIRAFHLTEETLMERCLSYFLDTQNEDGSWGFIENGNGLGTLEETAFALQGLLYYDQQVERIDMSPIHRGIEYVLDHYPCATHPEMWIHKVLYSNPKVTEGVIEGALLMYKNAVRSDILGLKEPNRWD